MRIQVKKDRPTALKMEMDWSNLYDREIPLSINGLSIILKLH